MAKIILKEYLKDRKISITRLSEMSGIGRVSLTNMCNNKTDGIRLETIESICRTLNCELKDIVSLECNSKSRTE